MNNGNITEPATEEKNIFKINVREQYITFTTLNEENDYYDDAENNLILFKFFITSFFDYKTSNVKYSKQYFKGCIYYATNPYLKENFLSLYEEGFALLTGTISFKVELHGEKKMFVKPRFNVHNLEATNYNKTCQ